MKTMNNKMAINTDPSTTESNKKKKLSKQETESGIWRVCDGCQMGRGCGGMGEEVRGLRSTNR